MSDTNGKSGRGYIHVEMTITKPERFKDYTALSAPTVQAAGGMRPEVIESTFDAHRVVVVEFRTAARARAFYHSAAYQVAKARRARAATSKMLFLEGPAGRFATARGFTERLGCGSAATARRGMAGRGAHRV